VAVLGADGWFLAFLKRFLLHRFLNRLITGDILIFETGVRLSIMDAYAMNDC